jgi:hypothetical protein
VATRVKIPHISRTEELPSYDDVLEMLSAKARDGSVSAMVALERALRPKKDQDHVDDELLDDELERLLNDDD